MNVTAEFHVAGERLLLRRTLSERVVDEVAAARGVAPVERERPLNDTVDPTRSTRSSHPNATGRRASATGVGFSSDGDRVVRKDGEIRLDPPGERST